MFFDLLRTVVCNIIPTTKGASGRRERRYRFRTLRMELLEDRQMLTTWIVNTNIDERAIANRRPASAVKRDEEIGIGTDDGYFNATHFEFSPPRQIPDPRRCAGPLLPV